MCSNAKPTVAQQIALDGIGKSVGRFGRPPSDLSGPGALRELRARHGYTSSACTVAQISLNTLDLVSLPSEALRPKALEDVAKSRGQELGDLMLTHALTESEARERMMKLGVKKPHTDPALLRNPKLYAKLLNMLHSRGLVKWKLTLEQVWSA